LGSSLALFMAIAILIVIPPKHPKTFSTAYFMANFCVFRVVLSITLTIWGTGAVARVCEDNHINVNFLLGVDPRCRIGPEFLFVIAALLTSAWIMIFGMYVIDYKWMVLPQVMAKTGFNKRSSGLYVLYPISILLVTLLLAFGPSKICRNRYKKALLGSVARTALAPLFSVSFADNLVGDVWTSLAKPLQEIPAALCYLFQYHPLSRDVVDAFVVHGNTCPAWEQTILTPSIAGAPFLFRLLQCTRRYHDTGDCRHLWNFGKYLASLMVVVVTSIGATRGSIIFVSSLATIYAAFWDIFLDWGLGCQELPFLPRWPFSWPHQERSQWMSTTSQDRNMMNDNFVVEQRRFSPLLYTCVAIFDLAARSTWALTLMPVTLLSDSIVQRALLQTLVALIEIARRTVWAVLRIENEQITNVSGFREFLWVPLKMNKLEVQTARTTRNGLEAPLLP